MSGKIQGKGLTVPTADFTLDGQITSAGILKYDYRNITTRGRFSNHLFEGEAEIRDPNLKMRVAGSVDLRNEPEVVRISARIDTAALQALKLSQTPFSFSTRADINTTGLTQIGRAHV